MSNNKWKEYILKSGLPLEFEVKNVLNALGIWTENEFSYIREDEDSVPKEFSFDISSEILIGNHCFDLLVECKYRDQSTNWFFLPEEYNRSSRGVGSTSFSNTNDFFYTKEYFAFFPILNLIKVSPLCSKGIEICSTGPNPKSIDQAIAQLSYAMIDKVILGIERQLTAEDKDELFIFHHVPVIVTTANIFRLKQDMTIDSVKSADSIEDIAEQHEILLIEPAISQGLRKHIEKRLQKFELSYSTQFLNERLNPKAKASGKDFEYCKKEISDFPQGIIVLQHSKDGAAFKKLVEAFQEMAKPSCETVKKLKSLGNELKNIELIG